MLFLSLLTVVVGVTTWMTEGVVKVEFGLEGIIQGCKVRQECLHNHHVWHFGAFTRFNSLLCFQFS